MKLNITSKTWKCNDSQQTRDKLNISSLYLAHEATTELSEEVNLQQTDILHRRVEIPYHPFSTNVDHDKVKVKVGVLRQVQQPGSYWDRSSALLLVGVEPTEVTASD